MLRGRTVVLQGSMRQQRMDHEAGPSLNDMEGMRYVYKWYTGERRRRRRGPERQKEETGPDGHPTRKGRKSCRIKETAQPEMTEAKPPVVFGSCNNRIGVEFSEMQAATSGEF